MWHKTLSSPLLCQIMKQDGNADMHWHKSVDAEPGYQQRWVGGWNSEFGNVVALCNRNAQYGKEAQQLNHLQSSQGFNMNSSSRVAKRGSNQVTTWKGLDLIAKQQDQSMASLFFGLRLCTFLSCIARLTTLLAPQQITSTSVLSVSWSSPELYSLIHNLT